MGASGWNYFVPYQPDVNQALQALRQDAFKHGDYFLAHPYWRGMTLKKFMPPDEYNDHEQAEYATELQRLQALPQPTTIEELKERNGTEGCHSILDIDGVSDTPKSGTISPLTPAQLHTLFGTTQPTQTMVEQAQNRYDELREQWEGLYIVVYQDGRPDEIFFTGFSGD